MPAPSCGVEAPKGQRIMPKNGRPRATHLRPVDPPPNPHLIGLTPEDTFAAIDLGQLSQRYPAVQTAMVLIEKLATENVALRLHTTSVAGRPVLDSVEHLSARLAETRERLRQLRNATARLVDNQTAENLDVYVAALNDTRAELTASLAELQRPAIADATPAPDGA
jgi:chromosome condensin MukBEF ATPase and DNA-binding subunit MukB